MLWYSTSPCLTSLATGLRSFCAFRFLLGAGEAANWPGATKAVSEWFPRRERGWAVALFDSGSSVGAAVAPALVLFLSCTSAAGVRPFVLTGFLGFLWLVGVAAHLPPARDAPFGVGEAEREMILADHAAEQAESPSEDGGQPPSWTELLRLRQTWGAIASRALTDPVWFMIADWFAIYLVAKGFELEETAAGFWVPFLAADLGNFFGGGFSGRLIRRGWPVGRARKAVIVGGAFGRARPRPGRVRSPASPPSSRASRWRRSPTRRCRRWPSRCPADLYQSRAVATVAGPGRHRRRPRHHRLDVPDRPRRRPLLLHAHPRGGERRPALRRLRSSSSSCATPPAPDRAC